MITIEKNFLIVGKPEVSKIEKDIKEIKIPYSRELI